MADSNLPRNQMSDSRLDVRASRLDSGATNSQTPDSAAQNSINLDERLRQLERKFLEQERTISGLRDDLKSFKLLQEGDRKECHDGLEHQNAKKRKLFGLVDEHGNKISAIEQKVEALQGGDREATSADIRFLSVRVDELRTQVDQITAGIHASNAPPAPDLIGFSPGSLINFNDDASEEQTTNHSLSVETLAHAKEAASRKERIEGSTLEKALGPATRHSRMLRSTTSPEAHQRKQLQTAYKHVRFDLSDNTQQERKQGKRVATISDMGSDDLLALDAVTQQTSNPSKTATSSIENAVASPTSSNASPKSTDILDRFRSGKLDSESDDEIDASAPVASSSETSGRRNLLQEKPSRLVEEDLDDSGTREEPNNNVDLAARAVVLIPAKPLNEPANAAVMDQAELSGTRKSQRVRKLKDFGDVEVHGWKKNQRKRQKQL